LEDNADHTTIEAAHSRKGEEQNREEYIISISPSHITLSLSPSIFISSLDLLIPQWSVSDNQYFQIAIYLISPLISLRGD
jgi:hypothetical protein